MHTIAPFRLTLHTVCFPFLPGDASSASVSGGILSAGGAAIAKALYVGTTFGVSGIATFSATGDATSSTASTGVLIAGGAAVSKSVYVGTNLNVAGTSALTGAASLGSTLVVSGIASFSASGMF